MLDIIEAMLPSLAAVGFEYAQAVAVADNDDGGPV